LIIKDVNYSILQNKSVILTHFVTYDSPI